MEYLKEGSNLLTVRENNLALLIRLIHKKKVCSRVELSKETGLKQATITNIVNDLIRWGVVAETGFLPGRGKRRAIGISLNQESFRIIGVRLNRKYAQTGLFDLAGNLLEKKTCSFQRGVPPAETVRSICAAIEALLGRAAQKKVLGIGIAMPGPFVPESGRIAMMSGFPGWDRVDLKGELERQLLLPVYLEHDANCGALAELWYGGIDSQEDVLFVAADTGVGAGILVRGQLYTGSQGMAGEIGHISIDYQGPVCECGNRGCLELYCSTQRLVQRYQEEAQKAGNTIEAVGKTEEEILKKVADAEPLARRVFGEVAGFLGIGLASAVNAYNPGVIILSDKMALAGQYLVEVIAQALKERLLPSVFEGLRIRLGAFAEDGMLYGAGALVIERMLSMPSESFKPPA